jgi:hypothetical protein
MVDAPGQVLELCVSLLRDKLNCIGKSNVYVGKL